MRYIQSRGASSEHAEEIAQEAWTRGWERLAQLREDGMVGFWANTIAINEFRRRFRKERLYVELEETRGQIGVDHAPIDAATILGMCNASHRALFAHQSRGLTTEEIATELGATGRAPRIRLHRARITVRQFVLQPRSSLEAEIPVAA